MDNIQWIISNKTYTIGPVFSRVWGPNAKRLPSSFHLLSFLLLFLSDPPLFWLMLTNAKPEVLVGFWLTHNLATICGPTTGGECIPIHSQYYIPMACKCIWIFKSIEITQNQLKFFGAEGLLKALDWRAWRGERSEVKGSFCDLSRSD